MRCGIAGPGKGVSGSYKLHMFYHKVQMCFTWFSH